MDDRAAWEREMVRVFLAEHDAPCPGCGYNLRGTTGDKCPECAAALELGLKGGRRKSRWDTLAVIAVCVSALYFLAQGGFQVWMLVRGVYRGTSLAPIRLEMAIHAGLAMLVGIVCLGWCIAIRLARPLRPRPSWAEPTHAASGVLLGTFVLYVVVYTLRYLM